jgi:hypothetical protein
MNIMGSLKHDQDALTVACVIDQELQAEIRSFLGMVRRMLIECLSALRIAFRR